MRLLARYRISRTTEASTSLERQEDACEGYARIHGHTIVDRAVDPDVSGSLSPFDTPEFGEKLRYPEEYDGVIAWKLDRLGRTLFGLNDLFKWAAKNDKTLISVEDNLDLSTWVGRLIASVIAGVAEGELEAIKSRTQSSQRHLRTLGRWHGGRPPYGYAAVKGPEGWFLEPHPDRAAVVRDIFARVAAGESLRSVGLSLTVPAPRGGAWTVSTLRQMIRAQWPLGLDEHEGRLVIDADGLPLQRAEPLVTHEIVMAARHALSQRTPKVQTRRNDPGLLLNVAYCAECGAKLYVWSHAQKGRVYRYWRCGDRLKGASCTNTPIAAKKIEPLVIDQFLSQVGAAEIVERVHIGGTDTAAQRQRLDDALQACRKEKDLGLYEGDEASYLARLTELTAQRRLLPDTDSEAQWIERGTGQTYGEQFVRADAVERRALLLRSGVTVRARAKPFEFKMSFPDDLRRNLPGRAFGTPEGMSVSEAEYWSNIALARGDDDEKPGAGQ